MPVARVDGRLATGLERPDVFNWFTYIRDALVRLEPRAIVVSFGANDDHDYMTGIPPGITIGPFGSSSWIDEYRRRVGGLMDEITAAGPLPRLDRRPDRPRRRREPAASSC